MAGLTRRDVQHLLLRANGKWQRILESFHVRGEGKERKMDAFQPSLSMIEGWKAATSSCCVSLLTAQVG